LQFVHREFSYKSPGERILKIGPHLPKLLSNIKGLGFFSFSFVIGTLIARRAGLHRQKGSCGHIRGRRGKNDMILEKVLYCAQMSQIESDFQPAEEVIQAY